MNMKQNQKYDAPTLREILVRYYTIWDGYDADFAAANRALGELNQQYHLHPDRIREEIFARDPSLAREVLLPLLDHPVRTVRINGASICRWLDIETARAEEVLREGLEGMANKRRWGDALTALKQIPLHRLPPDTKPIHSAWKNSRKKRYSAGELAAMIGESATAMDNDFASGRSKANREYEKLLKLSDYLDEDPAMGPVIREALTELLAGGSLTQRMLAAWLWEVHTGEDRYAPILAEAMAGEGPRALFAAHLLEGNRLYYDTIFNLRKGKS